MSISNFKFTGRLNSAVQFKVVEQPTEKISRGQIRLPSGAPTAYTASSNFNSNHKSFSLSRIQSGAQSITEKPKLKINQDNDNQSQRVNNPLRVSTALPGRNYSLTEQSIRQNTFQKQAATSTEQSKPFFTEEKLSVVQSQNRPQSRNSLTSHQVKNIIIVNEQNIDSPEIQRRSKFDPDVKQQVLRIRIFQVKEQNIKALLNHFAVKQKWFMDAFKQKAISRLLELIQEFVEYACNTKRIVVVLEIIQFAAIICENMLEQEKAVYFYSKLRTISSNTGRRFDRYKICVKYFFLSLIKALTGLAQYCIEKQKFEEAIKLLKKCLQYCWASKSLENEIEVYNQMSLCYFYRGSLQKSQFYHERALLYDYELDSSPLKQMGVDMLKIFLEKNYMKYDSEFINLGLLTKFLLPIETHHLNKDVPDFDLPTSTFSIRQDPFLQKKQGFSTIITNGMDILNEILKEKEFELEIYTPKHSFRSEAKCFEHFKKEKKSSDTYHNQKVNAFNMSHIGIMEQGLVNLEDTDKYKLPLKNQIEIRLKKKFNIENAFQKIYSQVSLNKTNLNQRKDKIQVSILYYIFYVKINHKNTKRKLEQKLLNEKTKRNAVSQAINSLIMNLIKIGNNK